MNQLRSVRRLRPIVEPLDSARSERIWAEITGTSSAQSTTPTEALEPEPGVVLSFTTAPDRSRRPYLAVAAAAVAVAGLGAVVGARSIDRTAQQPAPAATSVAAESEPTVDGRLPTPSADEVTMILQQLPDGLSVVAASSPTIRRDQSTINRFLYGAADDPGDPSRMFVVELDPTGTSVIPCHSFTSMPDPQGSADNFDPAVWQAAATPVAGSTSFTVPAQDHDGAPSAGAGCVGPNGLPQAGWFADRAAIGVTGGDAVGTAFLIELAQGVVVVGADANAVEVTSNPFAYDFMPLVNDDLTYTDEITETAWIASDATLTDVEREQAAAEGRPVDEPGELAVTTWYGAGNAGVYAIATPLGAERITVRGHPGYLFASADEVQIWWAEAEELVVRVRSSNLYDTDEVMALIDELQPASHAEFSLAATTSG